MISGSLDHKGQRDHEGPSGVRILKDKNRKAQTVT